LFHQWHFFNLLVLRACTRMWFVFAAINCRIPQTTVVRGHVDFGTDTTLLTFYAAFQHFLPHLEVLLNG
jgi:hypothetical protein